MSEQSTETAHITRTLAALADDDELMWRMGVREWGIVGGISNGLRAEVIRQSREHVTNLVDALNDAATCECSPAEVERGMCILCGRPFPAGGVGMSLDNRSRAQWREVYEQAMGELRAANKRARRAEARLAATREYVDDPGNWSTLDGRRAVLLDLIDANDHDPATNPACAFAPMSSSPERTSP